MGNVTLTTNPIRRTLARVIGLASPFCGLYVLWQIVPFFRGQITSPLIVMLNRAAPLGVKLIGSWDAAFSDANAGFAGFFGYYLVGCVSFVVASCLVMLAGAAIARVLLVGWQQFKHEQIEGWKAEQKEARIEAARERRRERRLAALRATRKSGDCGWLLIAGAIVFARFL
ncbi:hypothetical protein [Paraburkholderia sp. BL17N1]|uniref:hypothetical protein n=1 Tax=Paraburkholderia sp. BL17N1 TaxID=1938798 RepID=UPI000EB3729C|nr:hypothetical protein [Paraburkholderia sp. BL17N1]RKR31706.1 hypothetical protein B0G82_7944 [Paraburkholderia sp. BL17N1]